ncbi:MAG: hypothetical protein IKO73_05845 [Bacteroidaceae bacterium]|nr:hypothetical protein [Bacteroidaceae bacterium]
MRHYSLFVAITCILISLASCEKKDYSSYPPTWKGFRFTRNGQEISKNNIYAGDVITVTALQNQKGQNINATTYNWDITITVLQDDNTNKDSIISKSIHTNYDGIDSGDPSYTFQVPEKAVEGNYLLEFSATYAYSGHGIQIEDGGTYEGSSNISGSIHSTSGDMYGSAKGTVRFTVNNQ